MCARLCKYFLDLLVYLDICADCSQKHTHSPFFKSGRQSKTYKKGLLKPCTCNPTTHTSHIENTSQKKNSPIWNHRLSFLCITFCVEPYCWFALGPALNISLGAFGRTRRKREESGPDWPKWARLKHSWLTTNRAFYALPFSPHISPNPTCVSHFPLE